jgi:crossover junction endodeoxyribonuclease RusA
MSNKLTLPFPPSINHYWKHRAIGRRASVYLSSEAIAYREAVKNTLQAAKPLQTRLSVSVQLHAPNRRKYDIDNRVKSLLDALTHSGYWQDDELIDQLHIERGNIINGGLCVVEVSELNS